MNGPAPYPRRDMPRASYRRCMSAVRSAARDDRGTVTLRASDAAYLDCDCDETYTDCAGRTAPVDDPGSAHLGTSFVWDRLTGWDLAASDLFSLVSG